jgi:hypothetical protein
MPLIFFLIYLILLPALGPDVYSATNRSEYQKENKIFLVNRERQTRNANITGSC